MKDFILSLDAEQDLNEIWEYIASDNPDAAHRISQEIYRAIQGLVEMPRKGQIVRIIHGARDIRNLL